MNFQLICRVCLEKSRKLTPICHGTPRYVLTDFIRDQFNVLIQENDGFPQKICKSCLDKMDIVYDLKNTVQQSDKCLRLQIDLKSEENESESQEIVPLKLEIEDVVQESNSEPYAEPLSIISFEPTTILEQLDEKEDNESVDSCNSKDPDFKIDDFDEVEKETKIKKRKRNRNRKVDNKPSQCLYCGKVFKNGNHLRAHEKLHTDEKSFECDICHKKFMMKSYLTRHFKAHINERQYKCSACPKGFNTSTSLRDHFRLVHSGQKNFVCSFCQKAFPLKQQLKSHLRIHTGEKPHQCTFCDKKYSHKIDLKRHIMLHTGIKPYKCPHCDRTFTKKSNMECHIPTHTGEKPYKCHICNREFRQPCPYKKHMQIEHKIEDLKQSLLEFQSLNETANTSNSLIK